MGAFVATELANFESPVGSGALGDYDPSFRIGDGWLQDFRKGPGTVIGEKPDPRVKERLELSRRAHCSDLSPGFRP